MSIDNAEAEQAAPRAWMAQANCRGIDPVLMFPRIGDPAGQAKRVCAACVVRDDCLEYALDRGEKFGVWGGLSERERRRIRGVRRRAAARRAAVAPETDPGPPTPIRAPRSATGAHGAADPVPSADDLRALIARQRTRGGAA